MTFVTINRSGFGALRQDGFKVCLYKRETVGEFIKVVPRVGRGQYGSIVNWRVGRAPLYKILFVLLSNQQRNLISSLLNSAVRKPCGLRVTTISAKPFWDNLDGGRRLIRLRRENRLLLHH